MHCNIEYKFIHCVQKKTPTLILAHNLGKC